MFKILENFTVILIFSFRSCWSILQGKFCLTLNALMDPSIWFDTIHLGWSIVYIKGSQVITSKIIFFIGISIFG